MISIGPVAGGAFVAGAASNPFGTTKFREGEAKENDSSNQPRMSGVLSTRAALVRTNRASMRAPSHCVNQPRCHCGQS
jgi:hypothetical protein